MTRSRSIRAPRAVASGVFLLSAAAFAIVLRADAVAAWRILLANLLFWSGLTAGSAALVALFELTGARWPGAIRRIAETAIRAGGVTYLFYLLLLPAMRSLFGSRAGLAWIPIRDVLALAVFQTACVFFLRRSAAVVLLIFVAVTSLVAIDLVMAFDPGWTSTLFPAYLAVTNVYGAIAAATIAGATIDGGALGAAQARDVGKLLLGFSLLWLYLFWSQYLVIWYGNLPNEFTFMIDRTRGSWHLVAAIVLACCCGVPAGLLIVRRTAATAVFASCACLIGIWLERLLLVFPPHRWSRIDFLGAPAVALGFAAAFALFWPSGDRLSRAVVPRLQARQE